MSALNTAGEAADYASDLVDWLKEMKPHVEPQLYHALAQALRRARAIELYLRGAEFEATRGPRPRAERKPPGTP